MEEKGLLGNFFQNRGKLQDIAEYLRIKVNHLNGTGGN